MSNILILVVAGIYLLTSLDLFWRGQGGMSLTFFAYSVSNIGLWLATRGF
jgi:hypothetical protein